MKIIGKAITPLFIVAVFLVSCNNSASPTSVNTTDVAGTAMAIVKTSIVETQGAIPTITFTPQLPTLISPTSLPPTETPTPIKTSLPISGTPTAIVLENGLTWSECIVPNRMYSMETADKEFLDSCIKSPDGNEYDRKWVAEHILGQDLFYDLRITIGNDVFETEHYRTDTCCNYKLMKNGEVIVELHSTFAMTHDPNRHFWNIEGVLVWELAGVPPFIVVNGENFNDKYQLEGSFFPYEIRGKLIYIAKKNGTYHIVYNNKVVGPEFDDIQITYGGSMASVYYGSGQYWFLGRRDGTKYVVSIQ